MLAGPPTFSTSSAKKVKIVKPSAKITTIYKKSIAFGKYNDR
jgi:hypothetical protein